VAQTNTQGGSKFRGQVRPTDQDLHPAVVLSRTAVCADARKQTVNVLFGTTKRPAGEISPTDVALNSADGLERLTLINCDHIYTVRKDTVDSRLGSVSYERRRALCRTLARAFAFVA